jgi:preprotein translocase SecF subunit
LLLIYVWFRFDIQFAPGAILALFHDAVVTLGVFSLLGMEINLTVLAAILTLVGYSLNDTIVIYDRVRENMHRMEGAELGAIINVSVNQTLSRTVLTSGATLLVTIALLLFGGEILYNFAFALTFGMVIGVYSTIYVASPMAIYLDCMLKKGTKAKS